MKNFCLNLRFTLFISFLLFSNLSNTSLGQINIGDKISLLFIGDIMGHDDQILAAKDTVNNTYNYNDVFRYIKPVISEADIAIANFEATLAGPPYKGYPQFSSPAELAVACRDAEINCFVTANNHVADRGKRGIISTINKLDSIGILHTGSFLNSACRDSLSPLMINSNGASIALLNYTYGTNGIEIPIPVIVNPLDMGLITSDIEKARNNHADIIILFLHWGTEYDTIPGKEQIDLTEYFFSIGADLVIGSHPHVLQKMIWTNNPVDGKDNIVVYSLGNFVSNQRKTGTDGGSMVRIDFTRNGNKFNIEKAEYFLTWVYTPIENHKKKYYILPCSEYENRLDFFSNPDDYIQMKRFSINSRKFLNRQNINIKEYINK
ncbi:MAG TPA: CapA family protein [Bacteroidales bacterium]|nr:CapA family protein [Bacteroidales bacterium]